MSNEMEYDIYTDINNIEGDDNIELFSLQETATVSDYDYYSEYKLITLIDLVNDFERIGEQLNLYPDYEKMISDKLYNSSSVLESGRVLYFPNDNNEITIDDTVQSFWVDGAAFSNMLVDESILEKPILTITEENSEAGKCISTKATIDGPNQLFACMDFAPHVRLIVSRSLYNQFNLVGCQMALYFGGMNNSANTAIVSLTSESFYELDTDSQYMIIYNDYKGDYVALATKNYPLMMVFRMRQSSGYMVNENTIQQFLHYAVIGYSVGEPFENEFIQTAAQNTYSSGMLATYAPISCLRGSDDTITFYMIEGGLYMDYCTIEDITILDFEETVKFNNTEVQLNSEEFEILHDNGKYTIYVVHEGKVLDYYEKDYGGFQFKKAELETLCTNNGLGNDEIYNFVLYILCKETNFNTYIALPLIQVTQDFFDGKSKDLNVTLSTIKNYNIIIGIFSNGAFLSYIDTDIENNSRSEIYVGNEYCSSEELIVDSNEYYIPFYIGEEYKYTFRLADEYDMSNCNVYFEHYTYPNTYRKQVLTDISITYEGIDTPSIYFPDFDVTYQDKVIGWNKIQIEEIGYADAE